MKRKKMNLVFCQCCITAVIFFALTACSTRTLSEEQCRSGNWQAIGYNDGVAGRLPTYIHQHQKSCAKAGVIPDFQAWEEGRKQGLVHYCTEANARRLGLEGRKFNPVCPPDQVEHLQYIHEKAYQHYEREKQIDSDEKELRRYRSELSKLRSGDMMHFKSESEAREYMLEAQRQILTLEKRIDENQRANNVE